jgi:hypothetical protein
VSGVAVTVSDDTASRLGNEWVAEETKSTPKKASSSKSEK